MAEALGAELRRWWPVLFGVAGVIAMLGSMWGNLSASQDEIKANQHAGRAAVGELTNRVGVHNEQVRELFQALMNIQNEIQRLDQRQREMDRQLNIIIGRKNLQMMPQ